MAGFLEICLSSSLNSTETKVSLGCFAILDDKDMKTYFTMNFMRFSF